MKMKMTMPMAKVESEVQKVLVIQTGMDCSGIQWVVTALSLSPGDELVLLAFLHLATPPRTLPSAFSLSAAARILGYSKGKEDSNKKFIAEELSRKKQHCQNNAALIELLNFCEIHKIKASVEVEACSSRKAGAVRAAKRLRATWVVLDREMKKDKQYFMDRLSCGISSMKSSNTIKKIRDPANEHVSYDEMIPSYSWEAISPSKSLGDQTAASCKVSAYGCSSKLKSCKSESLGTALRVQETEYGTSKIQVIADKFQREMEIRSSVCSVCNNRRLKFSLQLDFTYSELYDATDGFSRHNFLSQGGFGSVYKGKLKDGLTVAVKQLKAASLQGEKEFKAEVCVLSQARHPNLVVLLGSCAERKHRLLVYEYICNGSLEEHLSGERSSQPLNWKQRVKIASGAANGLAYLHAQNIVHRDMRPGNILITHDHESLLGDFGLARTQQDHAHSCDTSVVGTLGYMAPEYAESGRMSTKTDVYSFGVVLLQLITGRRTTDEIPGGKSLVGWAKPLLETRNYPGLIDKRILDSHDVHQLFWMVLVAENCLKKDPCNRWTMEQVEYGLNCIRVGKTNLDFSPSKGESSCRILDSKIK